MKCLPGRMLMVASLTSWMVCSTSLAAQKYTEVATFKLHAGTALAAAVDTAARRLYVAGSEGVAVLNADSGVEVGRIAGITKATDVLLANVPAEDGRAARTAGFIVSGAAVTMFDPANGKAAKSVPLQGMTRLCFDRFANQVVAVGEDSLASVDAGSGELVNSGRVHAGAGQIACGTLGHVYVADPEANVVHVLNHSTLKNDGDYTTHAGCGPSGLALDTKGRRLFVACEDGTTEILDTDSGFEFAHMRSGKGAAHGVFVWTPQGKEGWKAGAFFVHVDGTLTGIRMMAYIRYVMGGEWKSAPGAGGLTYDEKTHLLFVVSGETRAASVAVLGY